MHCTGFINRRDIYEMLIDLICMSYLQTKMCHGVCFHGGNSPRNQNQLNRVSKNDSITTSPFIGPHHQLVRIILHYSLILGRLRTLVTETPFHLSYLGCAKMIFLNGHG
jgi:hypothetical protein